MGFLLFLFFYLRIHCRKIFSDLSTLKKRIQKDAFLILEWMEMRNEWENIYFQVYLLMRTRPNLKKKSWSIYMQKKPLVTGKNSSLYVSITPMSFLFFLNSDEPVLCCHALLPTSRYCVLRFLHQTCPSWCLHWPGTTRQDLCYFLLTLVQFIITQRVQVV